MMFPAPHVDRAWRVGWAAAAAARYAF